jgi:hypothetical protein
VTLLLEFGIGNVKIIKKRILVSISRIFNVQIPSTKYQTNSNDPNLKFQTNAQLAFMPDGVITGQQRFVPQ